MSEDLKAETESILLVGGALETDVRCLGENNWTVGAAFAFGDLYPRGKPYWGNTARTGMDPRDMARHHVAAFAEDVAGLAATREMLYNSKHEAEQISWRLEEQPEPDFWAGEHVPVEHPADEGADSGCVGIDAEGGTIDAAAILIKNQPNDIKAKGPRPAGPDGVAYFGDNIHTIRLAKLGRLSQISRASKEVLQGGWTTEEFSEVQNYVVGNTDDIGTFIGDPERYNRFIWISDRQRGQRRIDAYREKREAELEALDRADVEEFDPEMGWPDAT